MSDKTWLTIQAIIIMLMFLRIAYINESNQKLTQENGVLQKQIEELKNAGAATKAD